LAQACLWRAAAEDAFKIFDEVLVSERPACGFRGADRGGRRRVFALGQERVNSGGG
jgi:hypothetical protein